MKPIVLDFETSICQGVHTGPKNKETDIYTVIAGINPEKIRVIHSDVGFNRLLPEDVGNKLVECDLIVGHNLSFDIGYIYNDPYFRQFSINGGLLWDTQYVEYLLSAQRHSMSSLAELQRNYLGQKIKRDRISKLFAAGIGADKIIDAKDRCRKVWDIYNKYCIEDGATTLKIFQHQFNEAKKRNMLPIIKVYMNYLLGLISIQNTGLLIDKERCEDTLRDFKITAMEKLEDAIAIVKKYWSDPRLPEFNIQSPLHKSAILFGGEIPAVEKVADGFYKNGKEKFKNQKITIPVKGFNLPKTLTTESKIAGRYVTDEATLVKIISSGQFSEEVVSYCKLQRESMNYNKMCSTYLSPFLKLSIDGILYPNFNHAITATGRLSSSKPNMQNIPSHGEMCNYIQGNIIKKPGFKCVSVDYSMLEIYVVAWYSKDPALINDLLSGVDLHVKRLSYAEDISYEEAFNNCKVLKLPGWDEKRSQAKTISYQKAYGAGVKSLSRTTGLEEEIVQKIFDQEDIEYYMVKEFNKRVEDIVSKNTYTSFLNNFPKQKLGGGKGGKRFFKGLELLPIDTGDGNLIFDIECIRKYGVFTSSTGRRYSFEEFGKKYKGKLFRGFSPTQMKNYSVQGGAADIVASATAALFNEFKFNQDVQIVNTIHDSIWFYIKEDILDLTIKKIVDIMTTCELLPNKPPFVFPVEVEVGDDFASTEVYKL